MGSHELAWHQRIDDNPLTAQIPGLSHRKIRLGPTFHTVSNDFVTIPLPRVFQGPRSKIGALSQFPLRTSEPDTTLPPSAPGELSLDRHHVFPREFLKGNINTDEEINHGVNGVLLTKGSNQSLSKIDPVLYLKRILKDTQGLSDKELRDRVESHLVPYAALKSGGTTKSRYKNFIKQRADLVAAEIETLVKL